MALKTKLIILSASYTLISGAILAQGNQAEEIPSVPDEIPMDPTIGDMVQEQAGSGKPRNIYSNLKLTKEQKRQILEIKKGIRPSLIEAKKAIKTAKMAYKTSFDNVSTDDDLMEKFKALQSARQTLTDIRFQQMLKIRAILNKSQKKMFHQLKAELRKNPK